MVREDLEAALIFDLIPTYCYALFRDLAMGLLGRALRSCT